MPPEIPPLHVPDATLRRLRAEIDRVLRPLLRGSPRVALLDFPDHSNVGDSLIYLGELAILRALRVALVAVASHETYSRHHVAAARPDLFLLHGGGNLGDLWLSHQRLRERVLADFRETPVLQLPQSAHFASAENLARFAELARGHPRFEVLLRDEPSLRLLAGQGLGRLHLCPDLAFYAPLGAAVGAPRPRSVLRLFRTDAERVVSSRPGGAVDWLADDAVTRRLSRIGRRVSPKLRRGPRLKGWVDAYVAAKLAALRVARGVRLVEAASLVATDRLHAAILAFMLGRPVVYLDQSYGKLQAVLGAWLPGDPHIRAATEATAAALWTEDAPVPAAPRKLVFAVYSCQKNRATRQRWIRATWARGLPAGVVVVYVMGGPPPSDARADEVYLDCPDDYEGLPQKTLALLRFAVRHLAFDHLCKVDDDTMIFDVEAVCERVVVADYVGRSRHAHDDTGTHHFGKVREPVPIPARLLQADYMEGPLYALSRCAVERLAAADPATIDELALPCGYEDIMVGRLVARYPDLSASSYEHIHAKPTRRSGWILSEPWSPKRPPPLSCTELTPGRQRLLAMAMSVAPPRAARWLHNLWRLLELAAFSVGCAWARRHRARCQVRAHEA